MRYAVIDLEATCWEQGSRPDRMEIIELGAVLLATAEGPVLRTFDELVRPIAEPRLSAFCQQLTSIRQADVDRADPFPAVLARFLDWLGSEPCTWCSWGAYDRGQLELDCTRHRLPFPPALERHINLKRAYSALRGVRPTGMRGALQREGIPLEGTHHRGGDDARNIAKLARLILPWLEQDQPPT